MNANPGVFLRIGPRTGQDSNSQRNRWKGVVFDEKDAQPIGECEPLGMERAAARFGRCQCGASPDSSTRQPTVRFSSLRYRAHTWLTRSAVTARISSR